MVIMLKSVENPVNNAYMYHIAELSHKTLEI